MPRFSWRAGLMRAWPPVAVLSTALLLAACTYDNPDVLQVTGQIEGTIIHAGTRSGGRVEEVLVNEGDKVEAGDLLVRLETDEAQTRLDAAQAQLRQAEAQLTKLKNGATVEQIRQAEAASEAAKAKYQLALKGARDEELRAAQAAVDAAQAQFNSARSDFSRVKDLYQKDAVARRQYDNAEAAYEAAAAQLRQAREKRDMVAEGARDEEIAMAKADSDRAQAALDEIRRGAREEDIEAATAARDAAQAQVAQAKILIDESEVSAPRTGMVETVDVEPGDLVQPGAVVRLLDPEDLELLVYVGAGVLGYIETGQEVTFTTDAHGDETFRGKIKKIANTGEFTPRNLQTEEERLQQAFAVRIQLDSADGKLRPGMAATALFDVPEHALE